MGKVLKKQASKTEQAEALLQVRRQRLVPSTAKAALVAFVQQAEPDEMLFREAPEAYGYEFQSGGVVDMLGKLRSDFGTQKRQLEQDEMQAQHDHNQMRQQLQDNVENAEHEISRKKTQRAETQKQKADEEGELADTTKARDEIQHYLEND